MTLRIFHKLFTFIPHIVNLHFLVIQSINITVSLSWLFCVQVLACLAGFLIVLTRTIRIAYALQLPVHIHSCLSTTHLCTRAKLVFLKCLCGNPISRVKALRVLHPSCEQVQSLNSELPCCPYMSFPLASSFLGTCLFFGPQLTHSFPWKRLSKQ